MRFSLLCALVIVIVLIAILLIVLILIHLIILSFSGRVVNRSLDFRLGCSLGVGLRRTRLSRDSSNRVGRSIDAIGGVCVREGF